MIREKLLLLFVLLWCANESLSQNSLAGIQIKRAEGEITLDGQLDEAAWAASDSAYNFIQNFPSDTSLSVTQTVVYILYDDNYIYVGAKMYSPKKDKGYVTPSLRRDFRGDANDSFSVHSLVLILSGSGGKVLSPMVEAVAMHSL